MIKNIFLVLFSLLVSVGLGELSLRFIAPERLSRVPQLEHDGFVYLPNQTTQFTHTEWDYEIRINGDGFRDDIRLADVPAGSILVLGDSFSEGYGIALEDTYAKLTQQMLQKSAGFDGVVYNAGHTGTNTHNYIHRYREKFEDLRAFKTVVIGFAVGNDLVAERVSSGASGLGHSGDAPLLYRIKSFLVENSIIYNLTIFAVKAHGPLHDFCRKIHLCGQDHPSYIYLPKRVDKDITVTVDVVAEFAREIEANGQNLIILMIPTRLQIVDEYWAKYLDEVQTWAEIENVPEPNPKRLHANSKITTAFRARGVTVVDLTLPMIEETRQGQSFYFRWDGHWNTNGHQFAATQLANKLKEF